MAAQGGRGVNVRSSLLTTTLLCHQRQCVSASKPLNLLILLHMAFLHFAPPPACCYAFAPIL